MTGGLFKAGIAEGLGVFFLVLFGGAAICMDTYLSSTQQGGIGLLAIALAHGIALMVAVYITAGISGGHINPAVSIALALIGKCGAKAASVYVIMQILGGVVGGLAVWSLFPTMRDTPPYLGTPQLGEGVGMLQGIGTEALMTFALVIVVIMSAIDPSRRAKQMFGLAIGLTVTVVILASGPFTGGSVNPARYLGPAGVSGNLTPQAGVYIAGPILGAIVAGIFYKIFLETKEEQPETA